MQHLPKQSCHALYSNRQQLYMHKYLHRLFWLFGSTKTGANASASAYANSGLAAAMPRLCSAQLLRSDSCAAHTMLARATPNGKLSVSFAGHASHSVSCRRLFPFQSASQNVLSVQYFSSPSVKHLCSTSANTHPIKLSNPYATCTQQSPPAAALNTA
jgi:hypothetical protein